MRYRRAPARSTLDGLLTVVSRAVLRAPGRELWALGPGPWALGRCGLWAAVGCGRLSVYGPTVNVYCQIPVTGSTAAASTAALIFGPV